MKEFLSREGAAFRVRNVDEDEDAYSDLLALGIRTVPATIVGSRVIKGFDERALREAIAAGGAP